jgi:hypothetical protein
VSQALQCFQTVQPLLRLPFRISAQQQATGTAFYYRGREHNFGMDRDHTSQRRSLWRFAHLVSIVAQIGMIAASAATFAGNLGSTSGGLGILQGTFAGVRLEATCYLQRIDQYANG